MTEKILFVDDEQHILTSYRRTFRKDYQIVTALGPEIALEIIETKGPFAIVISDMRMPGMNGVELLARIKEISPDTVRMMLTGYADFNTAIEAINEGNIFRFLTKPCPPDSLIKVVDDGLKQFRLIKAEQELLNKTLKGSIKVLIDILSMIDQAAFSKSIKMRDALRDLTDKKIISPSWEIEVSTLLSQIGQVTVPSSVMSKMRRPDQLTDVEKKMIEKIPKVGYDLLTNIPRLNNVAKTVLYQNKNYDGTGFPEDDVKGLQIPLGARIIKILNDLIELELTGNSRGEAGAILNQNAKKYDPNLLNIIINEVGASKKHSHFKAKKPVSVNIKQLQVGQMLLQSIETETGQLLVLEGQEITSTILTRIKNWAKLYRIKEPITVTQ